MSIISGFFDSVNNDRLYDATQISGVFSGPILDGISSSIGNGFFCSKANSESVYVDSGFAYFKNFYILNTSKTECQISESTSLIVIELNEYIRNLSVKVINPQNLNYNIHMVLAKVIKDGSDLSITNYIGYSDNEYQGPYLITGLMQKTKIIDLLNSIPSNFNTFKTEFSEMINDEFDDFIEDNSYYLHHQDGSTQYDRFVGELNTKTNKPFVKKGTLQANEKTITFTGVSISDNDMIDIKMSDDFLAIENITISGSNVIISFYESSESNKEITLVVNK